MDALKKFFPISFKYADSGKNLAIGIILYIVVAIVASVAIAIAGLLTVIPVLGAILALALRILGAVVDVYVVAGIVIEILAFLKVFSILRD